MCVQGVRERDTELQYQATVTLTSMIVSNEKINFILVGYKVFYRNRLILKAIFLIEDHI